MKEEGPHLSEIPLLIYRGTACHKVYPVGELVRSFSAVCGAGFISPRLRYQLIYNEVAFG